MTRSRLDKLDPYQKTLLIYYEEEVMGEAYFKVLARHYDGAGGGEKMQLLAQVERRAAEAMEPLLQKYGLNPRDDAVLFEQGAAEAKEEKRSWPEFMDHMVTRYPAYVDEFKALERLAPEVDLPALEILTQHEVVAIEFAEKESAGDEDSVEPLLRYLEPGAI